MKTSNIIDCRSGMSATVLLIMVSISCLLQAGVPEPDNIVYGSISLDGVVVGAARTEVVVEARRGIGGPVLASYRMGSDSIVGDLYSLPIPLESGPEPISAEAGETGESLFIVVRDGSGDLAQQAYEVGERGQVFRLDFGGTVQDADGNGLPDLWELTFFETSGQDPDAVQPNGLTTYENFEAGSDPTSVTSRFAVTAELQGELRVMSFLARAAEGPGYDGYVRYYTLESSDGGDLSKWMEIPGFIDIVGANQTPVYQTPREGSPAFYRGRVRIEKP